MSEGIGGLVEVVLGKDWGKHRAGKKVRVDPLRAAALRTEGFLDEGGGVRSARRTGRGRAAGKSEEDAE